MGVLLSFDNFTLEKLSMITITISSDDPGIFNIVADIKSKSLMGVYREVLNLDNILISLDNNVTAIKLFDAAIFDLNLLVILINKKFYF